MGISNKVTPRKIWLTIAGAGIALGASAVIYQNVSKKAGVSRQRELISSLQDDLLDNQHEVAQLYVSMPQDFAGMFVPSSLETKILDGVKAGVDIADSISDKAYPVALSQAAEQTAKYIIDKPIEADNVVDGLSLLADSARLYDLLREQEQLVASLDKLYPLQDPAVRSELAQIAGNITTDQLLLDSLRNKTSANVAELELKSAAKVGANAVRHAANGIMIVDPSDGWKELQNIPQINPDFLIGLRCENTAIASMMQGGPPLGGPPCPKCAVGMPCDTYADGSYIPAFLGTDGAGNSGPMNRKTTTSARKWGTTSQNAQQLATVATPGSGTAPASASTKTPATFLNTEIKYMPMERQTYPATDRYGEYDPTVYSVKQVKVDPLDKRQMLMAFPTGGFVAHGGSEAVLANPINPSQKFADSGEGVMPLRPGSYTLEAMGVGDDPLPGFSTTTISINTNLVTVVNIPTGQIHVVLHKPISVWSDFQAMVEDAAGTVVLKNLNSSNPQPASPGTYKLVTGRIDGGKIMIDARYPATEIRVEAGKVTEITLTPASPHA